MNCLFSNLFTVVRNRPRFFSIRFFRIRFFRIRLIAVGLLLTSLVLSGCESIPGSDQLTAEKAAEAQTIEAQTIEAQTVEAQTVEAQTILASEMTVYRSPTCGCCELWIDHVRAAGFQVKDEVTEDIAAIKQQYGVPDALSACHTAVVGNYVVEGHIPVEDVQRLLIEKPDIAGITVPGMPIGSPGMDSGNGTDDYTEPYAVFSFTESGETAVFAEHL